jgi:DNA-directed RNA polymerase subunit RPC12/RpoP
MLRFGCPRCKRVLEADDSQASSKVRCPWCGQKLLTPAPPPPPVNKTALAIDLTGQAHWPRVPPGPPPEPAPPPVPAKVVEVVDEVEVIDEIPVVDSITPRRAAGAAYPGERGERRTRPRRRPAGSGQRHPIRRWWRDEGESCPFCGSWEEPYQREEIPLEAWIVFAVLVLVFFPVCWIPLVCMKKKVQTCYDCGRNAPLGSER